MSEQDFFFDDEDEKPAKQSKATAPEKKKAAAPASRPSRPASGGSAPSFWTQTVTMTVTSLVAAIALLLGVIVGIVLPVGGTGTATTGVPDPAAGVAAPSLTPEQLQSGTVPEGHPDIGGMTGGAGGVPTGTAVPTTDTPAE